jgi:hypothetical protein
VADPVTLLVVLSCDGTPADRPTMALSRCRAFLPLPFADPQTLAQATVAAGYRVHAGRYLCPACGRRTDTDPEEIGSPPHGDPGVSR